MVIGMMGSLFGLINELSAIICVRNKKNYVQTKNVGSRSILLVSSEEQPVADSYS